MVAGKASVSRPLTLVVIGFIALVGSACGADSTPGTTDASADVVEVSAEASGVDADVRVADAEGLASLVDVADADTLVPIAAVTFDLETPPAASAADLSVWLNGGHCTQDSAGHLDCPDLATTFGCTTVFNTGAYGVWLDPAVPPLLCSHCRPSDAGAYSCVDPGDGLIAHDAGLGGVFVDYLIVLDQGVPAALRSPADLAARYAPVDSAGEALAFVALAVPRAVHRYWPSIKGYTSNDVSWQQVDDQACVTGTLEGTRVESTDTGYEVRTFRVPDWSGCTHLALERLFLTVSREGQIAVEGANPLCYGVVPCYD